jgi:hypothetical protein
MDAWVLRRAAELLAQLEPMDLWNFFHQRMVNDSAKIDGKEILPL